MIFSGFIFDIEGTLVDCVPQTLKSLQESLKKHGLTVSYETLQLYSGLDGDETLKRISPSLSEDERKQLLEEDGQPTSRLICPRSAPWKACAPLFAAIKKNDGSIALATDCKGAPLRVCRKLLDVDELIDHIACGDDVPRGKPDPAVVNIAVRKLALPAGCCVMTGDTPYDCQVATAAGVTAMGLLTGGFAREVLLQAGAIDVLKEIAALGPLLSGAETVRS